MTGTQYCGKRKKKQLFNSYLRKQAAGNRFSYEWTKTEWDFFPSVVLDVVKTFSVGWKTRTFCPKG